jgi:hypothetical protein
LWWSLSAHTYRLTSLRELRPWHWKQSERKNSLKKISKRIFALSIHYSYVRQYTAHINEMYEKKFKFSFFYLHTTTVTQAKKKLPHIHQENLHHFSFKFKVSSVVFVAWVVLCIFSYVSYHFRFFLLLSLPYCLPFVMVPVHK